MRKLCYALALVLACCVGMAGRASLAQTPSTTPLPQTYIHAGRLIAVPGDAVKTKQTLVIRGGSIAQVLDGYVTPPETAVVIDLKAMTVLPGLIDAHTHLQTTLGPAAFLKNLTQTKVGYAFDAAANAKKTLLAGFTTVRDLGGANEVIFGLRDAIAKGQVPGPRILASGHQVHAVVKGGQNNVTAVQCSGADECTRITRRQIEAGADLIKVAISGGEPLTGSLVPLIVLFEDEVSAIVAAAETLDRTVACHAFIPETISLCLRAGVHSIEHGSYMDDKTAKLAKQTGAVFVPTLSIGPVMQNQAKTYGLDPARADAFSADMLAAVRIAKKRGIPIIAGSDSGPSAHGANAFELVRLVEAGLTPAEAIQAATTASARYLGLGDMLGALEPGKAADIIAVDGDPLSDITQLQDVDFVMRGGVVHKAP
ncbi:MAG: amidohydrolase family protein [Pseudomonadota bacterium]